MKTKTPGYYSSRSTNSFNWILKFHQMYFISLVALAARNDIQKRIQLQKMPKQKQKHCFSIKFHSLIQLMEWILRIFH